VGHGVDCELSCRVEGCVSCGGDSIVLESLIQAS
jgi:hypothetical protein